MRLRQPWQLRGSPPRLFWILEERRRSLAAAEKAQLVLATVQTAVLKVDHGNGLFGQGRLARLRRRRGRPSVRSAPEALAQRASAAPSAPPVELPEEFHRLCAEADGMRCVRCGRKADRALLSGLFKSICRPEGVVGPSQVWVWSRRRHTLHPEQDFCVRCGGVFSKMRRGVFAGSHCPAWWVERVDGHAPADWGRVVYAMVGHAPAGARSWAARGGESAVVASAGGDREGGPRGFGRGWLASRGGSGFAAVLTASSPGGGGWPRYLFGVRHFC